MRRFWAKCLPIGLAFTFFGSPLSAEDTLESIATRTQLAPCTQYSKERYDSGAGAKACKDMIASGRFKSDELATLHIYANNWLPADADFMPGYQRALASGPTTFLTEEIQRALGIRCYYTQRYDCAWQALEAGIPAIRFTDTSRFVDAGIKKFGIGPFGSMLESGIPQLRNNIVRTAMKSDLQQQAGNYEKAAEYAVKAAVDARIELNAPGSARAYEMKRDTAFLGNSACWLLGAYLHRSEEALVHCGVALELEPDNAAYLDSRAMAHLVAGRNGEALRDYDAGLAIVPNFAHLIYGKGIALKGLGRTAESNAAIASAIGLNPNIASDYASYGISTNGIVPAPRRPAPVNVPVAATAPAPKPAASAPAATPAPNTPAAKTTGSVLGAFENFNVDLPKDWSSRQREVSNNAAASTTSVSQGGPQPSMAFKAEAARCRADYAKSDPQNVYFAYTYFPDIYSLDAHLTKEIADDTSMLELCLKNIGISNRSPADKAAIEEARKFASQEVRNAYRRARNAIEADPAKYLTLSREAYTVAELEKELSDLRNTKTLHETCGYVDFSQPSITGSNQSYLKRRWNEVQSFGYCADNYRNGRSAPMPTSLEIAHRHLKATQRFFCSKWKKPNCIDDASLKSIIKVASAKNVEWATARWKAHSDQRSSINDLIDASNNWMATHNRRVAEWNRSF